MFRMILTINISLNIINRLVVAMEIQFVLNEVRADIIYIIETNFRLRENVRGLNLAAVKLTTVQVTKLPL
jgi:hypothetical protein